MHSGLCLVITLSAHSHHTVTTLSARCQQEILYRPPGPLSIVDEVLAAGRHALLWWTAVYIDCRSLKSNHQQLLLMLLLLLPVPPA